MSESYYRRIARRDVAGAIVEGRKMGLRGAALERHVAEACPWPGHLKHGVLVWIEEMRAQLKPQAKDETPSLFGGRS
jgi:hypothetical protein